ncbi:hypothetical protein ACFY5A_05755 [Microbacterium sp. NPDC012755]|uniref:DUF7933 domain-containing protein n=1 Tax=Microbacterium sp. NPDC012755 TaxID=3364184 RepID=UPI003676E8BF
MNPLRGPVRSAGIRRSRTTRVSAAVSVVAMLVAFFGVVDATTGTQTASAAPGSPGVPGAPSVLFQEDFQQGTGITELESYVSASGATYSADPFWLDATACNGFILSQANAFPGGSVCAGRATEWTEVQRKAAALGLLNSPQNTTTNRAVSSNTSSNGPANARQFISSQLSVPSNGRFITFSVDAAATNCGAGNQPSLRFYLTNAAGTETPVSSSAINPCTDSRRLTTTAFGGSVSYGRFTANGSMLYTSATLGITMRNVQGNGIGNDGAFDNIRVLDVTPQLDKSFSPTSVPTGGVSTLTLTVTNTSELAEKVGWSFTDSLPAGLVVRSPANVGGTCTATVAAAAGASSVVVSNGRLNAGQASCTITLDVTSNTAGTYTNCAANITAHLGIDLPACAAVRFFSFDPCVAVPVWTNTANALQQYNPTTFQLVSSTPLIRQYGDIAWSSNGSALYGVDYDGGTGQTPVLRRIDPVTGAELASVAITGPILTQATVPGPSATLYSLNALAALDVNTLLVGSYSSRAIYRLDVNTGVTTLWTQFPNEISSAGDFTVLPDGDILAFGVRPLDGNLSNSRVYRIHPDGSMTQIGTVPAMWGGAQSGGNFFMAAPSGQINRIPLATLPTAASTAMLSYTTVLSGGPQFYGASAVQDAGQCVGLTITKAPSPAVITGAGQTVTYSFTVKNISDVRIQNIVVTDVQQAPAGALTSGPTCPVTALNPGQSTVCTGTYVATNADVGHGRIDDTATAAGTTQDGRGVISNQATATVLIQPVLTWSLSKSASVAGVPLAQGAVVDPGSEISYTVTAVSAATVDITGVALSDDLADVLDDATFVPGSGQLVIGGGAPVAVADPAGTVLTAGPFTLPVGATATLTYRVTVAADAWSSTLRNVVTGNAGAPGQPTPPQPCGAACTTSQVTPTPVQVQKVGEASTGVVVPMDGSSWAIFSVASGGTAVVDSVPAAVSGGSPVTGLFRDVTLTAGTYWLEETRALDGFALLAGRVPFTVAADGTITLGAGVSSNVQLVDVDGIRTIRVEDVPALDLPDAGGPGTAWIYLIGLTLLLAGTTAGFVRSKRLRRAAIPSTEGIPDSQNRRNER